MTANRKLNDLVDVQVDKRKTDQHDGFEPQANSIWSAAAEGDLKAVKEHLAQSVDINAKEDKLDITALSLAALYDHAEIVAFLVQKGADVNVRGGKGETPIDSLKVDWGITEFVASLLQLKLDREKVETGRAKVAELLRQHGAK